MDQRIALVTGAASGLGEAIARRLASDGTTVVVADIDEAGADRAAGDIGRGAMAARLDVRSEQNWCDVLDRVRQRFGALHVLVNNAGITTMGSIEALSFEAFRHEFEVDVYSVFLGCKHGIALMKETGGSIINISSAAGLKANADLAAYNAAKAAVTMLTKSVALHCARERYGIRCNSVHPGAIHTPILDKVLEQVEDREAVLASFIAGHPIGHLGQPSDIAAIVAYLAGDESRFATGAEFVVDGGMTL